MYRLALLFALLMPLPSLAETLSIPLGSQGAELDASNLPHKGQSKRSVLERFGLADEEHKPVGQPPITRWDYREFSVYFEYDHVINSVRHHQPRHLDTAKEQQ
ncbi:phosphodiesterase [Pseudomonas wenzhouensis]|uniref:phosphodiesterase n=1 Tax=Pseudomonas wenzhouensis TaxID=2906062 RepID=UPI001E5EEBBE|nr:phosphodiesterase [Pseudomonas wenzhouensis]UFQ96398.1 phosphodiesterase [Pseudomonas wenzhouensis]